MRSNEKCKVQNVKLRSRFAVLIFLLFGVCILHLSDENHRD